jgi:uncharacterized membrane protein
MEFMYGGVLVLVTLVVIIGAVLGWVSIFQYRKLADRLELLQEQVLNLRRRAAAGMPKAAVHEEEKKEQTGVSAQPDTIPEPHPDVRSVPDEDRQQETKEDETAPPGPGMAGWFDSVRDNWMIWLGGICVGLAGIFLVKYSIDTGLLGPTQRVVLACVIGLGLHGLAEWLRRRTGEVHPAFAALAGGASIILYAAMLAALHLYDLLSPGIVFTSLALVSVSTMLLALRYGPVLAILGILGGYLVPVFVSEDSGNILGAMLYSLIISGAALLLIRYVYRAWLWYGVLVGGLGWWLISCTAYQADGYRGIYLAALAYSMLAIPIFDWFFTRGPQDGDPGAEYCSLPSFHRKWRYQPMQLSLVLILCAQAWSIAIESFAGLALVAWAPLVVVVLLGCRKRSSIRYLPWLSLVLQWFAWLYAGVDLSGGHIQFSGLGHEVQKDFLVFTLGMVVLYSGLTWLVFRTRGFSHALASIINLAPVLWLALAYLLVTDLSANWRWSLWCFALGMGYLAAATIRLERGVQKEGAAWTILAGHFALSLALAMYFREGTLTLVLATQLISLALLMNRFEIGGLAWLMKGLLGLIVIRLTVNPLLLQYPADIHWSLWTYGGSTLCCGVAAWLTRRESPVKKWLEAATLHLLVLFLAAETRYWLHDGNIFARDYTLVEASINTALWSMLGIAYYYRARVSNYLTPLYIFCSRLLLLLGVLNYGVVLTILNPLWSSEPVSATPVANILLLAYGFPVLAAILVYRFYDARYKPAAALVAAGGFLVLVSMQIRHLWNGALDLDLGFGDPELYTYSIVWLVMAVLSILLAASRGQRLFYRAGMVLLLVVIGKIFIIDMADLEGLLRVASFMGLGLSLLGLAYVYQKIGRLDD